MPEANKKPTLGVVAICLNEEKNLPGFLNHLLPWVDEIVIVDDGSTDRTHEILRAAGEKVKLIVRPRQEREYNSHQRNRGIDAAESDWLLHMDIDERVTPQLMQEIQQGIQDPNYDGYRFRRLNFFLGYPVRGSGWERWNKIHLARREKFRFGGKTHESCLLDAPPERVGQLEGLMWHLNDEDFGGRLMKSYKYGLVEVETRLDNNVQIHWYDLVISPIFNFLKGYILRRGYRDGMIGLLINLQIACATVRVNGMVWDAQNRRPRADLEREFEALWEAEGIKPPAAADTSTVQQPHITEA